MMSKETAQEENEDEKVLDNMLEQLANIDDPIARQVIEIGIGYSRKKLEVSEMIRATQVQQLLDKARKEYVIAGQDKTIMEEFLRRIIYTLDVYEEKEDE